jgi:hypothetical protein
VANGVHFTPVDIRRMLKNATMCRAATWEQTPRGQCKLKITQSAERAQLQTSVFFLSAKPSFSRRQSPLAPTLIKITTHTRSKTYSSREPDASREQASERKGPRHQGSSSDGERDRDTEREREREKLVLICPPWSN